MTATTGRRHYQKLAEVFKRAKDAGLDDTTIYVLACELADVLHHANNSFNYPKWYGAIGIEIPRCHQTTT